MSVQANPITKAVIQSPIITSCLKSTISVCEKHIALIGLAAGKNTLALHTSIRQIDKAATFKFGNIVVEIVPAI